MPALPQLPCLPTHLQAAGNAVGVSPLESTLRESLEELALLADGWYRRVTLAWPYPGGHVEIVGEAGGWAGRQAGSYSGGSGFAGALCLAKVGRSQQLISCHGTPPCPWLQCAGGRSGRRCFSTSSKNAGGCRYG